MEVEEERREVGLKGRGGVEGVSREKKCCVMDLLSTSPGCQEPPR